MKITLAMVMTLDGKITHGDNTKISEWTSTEDKTHFSQLLSESTLDVMGSKTYEAAKAFMKFSDQKLRVILTRTPEKYSSDTVTNQLEFSSTAPHDLVTQLEKRGFTEMLLLGGGETNAAFFQANLVDEMWLTVEPLIFGKGKPIIGLTELDTKLKLDSYRQLNDNGTLLLHYYVKK